MNLRDLKILVMQGEGSHLEFKRKASHPDKIMKEVVAFANAGGGTLLIGVDDNLTIPGLPDADEEEYILEHAIAKYCYPEVKYTFETIALTSRLSVLAYHIQPGEEKPYAVLDDFVNKTGTVYVRVNDMSVQASREVKQILRQRARQKDFRFEYGDKERLLMQYLDQHPSVTLSQFAALANIPRRQASQTLILLVLCNVLRIKPNEGEDLYFLHG
jgi:predicted HTH transcriptional regulator